MINNERSELGNIAHRLVSEEFLRIRRRRHLLLDQYLYVPQQTPRSLGAAPNVDISRGQYGNHFNNGDGLDPYLCLIRLLLQTRKAGTWLWEPAAAGRSRRPDLADVDYHELYEVKPDNARGQREGRLALNEFSRLLRQADAEYVAYSRQSPRYRGSLYTELSCRIWRGGSWVPPVLSTLGHERNSLSFAFRGCPRTPGLLLWRLASHQPFQR
ncbi:hypothetical protein [Planctopirus hydrillae]|uniref:Uncharacterized protein n=1 Tax=Planctopirus hydrillae TaxID=1841610 RepID=A0A1C3EIT5_9PLAN|nr:hypothetical protein [Planctopirus hydrillae]ODA33144.1 hypothetical protein A6X21_05100 [Planctopirus hydrillae]